MMRLRCPQAGGGILAECAEDKKWETGLNDALFDLNFFVRNEATKRQEITDIGRNEVAGIEERGFDLIGEVAMDVHFGALRIDEHAAGAVLKKERDVGAFVEDGFPNVGFAVVGLGPLPGLHTVVKAGIASDGSGESVRADGSTHDFNEADGGAVNFGEWGVEDRRL